jgi:hypothetical protein
MRIRSRRTSVRPSSSPSTRTVPVEGCRYSEAIRSRVVFPDPLAPSTTQRWSPSTTQSTSRTIAVPSRTTDTARSSRGRAASGGIAGDATGAP